MKEDWLNQNHIRNLDMMMMLNGWFLLHFQKRFNRCGFKHKKSFIYHRSISHQLRLLFLLKLWKEHWNSLITFKKKVLQLRMILLLRRLLCRCKPPKHQDMIKSLLHWELFILSCLSSVLQESILLNRLVLIFSTRQKLWSLQKISSAFGTSIWNFTIQNHF